MIAIGRPVAAHLQCLSASNYQPSRILYSPSLIGHTNNKKIKLAWHLISLYDTVNDEDSYNAQRVFFYV